MLHVNTSVKESVELLLILCKIESFSQASKDCICE